MTPAPGTLRVAYNATALLSPLTGVGQYARQIAQGLARTPGLAPEFFYGAAWGRTVRDEPLPGAATLLPWLRRHVPFSYELRRLTQGWRFRRHARAGRFDLYHEPNNLPLPFDGPLVLTVHDLSWIRHPEAHPVERVRAMNRFFEAGLRRAARVITDSAFVQREVTEVFGLAPERITVVPIGVEAGFQPMTPQATQPVLQGLGLTHGRYFLALGTLEPRKNLQTALAAYRQLPPALRQTHPLVVAGMSGWGHSALEQQLAPLVAAGQVRRLGYLPRADLMCVTAGATALIYPSIYEGFGLPPLEAMACGVPAVVSDVASLPEVVGDTGVRLPPQDADGFAATMARMAGDTAWRDALGRSGRARSLQFSWEACVQGTLGVYRQVVPVPSPGGLTAR